MSNGEQPAYPFVPNMDKMDVTTKDAIELSYGKEGMSKREAFAMAAMQGILASIPNGQTTMTMTEIAGHAVDAADELLKALEQ